MIDVRAKERLETFMDLFLEENKKVNLSAMRTKEQCWTGNILDSLALIDVLDSLLINKKDVNVLDIGTGGGFPLFPLAIMRPDIQFMGLDATEKKIAALQRIKKEMELSNIEFVIGRSEELAQKKKYRESFDIVTARGVAPLATLLEYSIPFNKVFGFSVFWKSLHVADEQRSALNAMKELRSSLHSTHEYELPNDFGKRQLLIFRKDAGTEDMYPREVGMPKKKPL